MYEYMYMYLYGCIHRYQYVNSITHSDIILLNSMRHQGLSFFFLTLKLLLGREFPCEHPDEILSYQDFSLQLTFAPSDMVKPRLFNSSPSESFQPPESF